MAATAANRDARRRHDLLLQIALQRIEKESEALLRRLRGQPELVQRRVAKLSDAPKPKKIGQRFGYLYPDGAEWFYARWCALECLHLWPGAPEIVRQYLESGDPDLAAPAEELPRGGMPQKDDVASVCFRHTLLRGLQSIPLTEQKVIAAAMSAMYAATGAIDLAAAHAIDALAWEVFESAESAYGEPFTGEQRYAAIVAARGKLQIRFAEVAKEIFGGEMTL